MGTPGGIISSHYIAMEFMRLGLAPLLAQNDAPDQYLQTVPVISSNLITKDSYTEMFLTDDPRFRYRFKIGKDCFYYPDSNNYPGITAPVVFAGGAILHVIVIRRFLLKPVADRRPREPTGGPYPLVIDPRPRKFVFQYSLLLLLVLATALAVIFGLWKYLAG